MTTDQLPRISKSCWNWQEHRICYTVQGSGILLILIHGFGASIGHWRQNVLVLASGGDRVFAIDLLGFGGSDQPAIDYSVEVWEALLADFCAAELVQEPAVFVGNSIGALLSLMILANHPDLARGGILLNAAAGLNHRPDELTLPLRVLMGTFLILPTDESGGFLIKTTKRLSKALSRRLYPLSLDKSKPCVYFFNFSRLSSCHHLCQIGTLNNLLLLV